MLANVCIWIWLKKIEILVILPDCLNNEIVNKINMFPSGSKKLID